MSPLPAPSGIESAPGQAGFAAVRADLGRRDDIVGLVDEAVRRMGRLDVVFSNGGWTRIRDMTSIDGKDFSGWDDRAERIYRTADTELKYQITRSRRTGTGVST